MHVNCKIPSPFSEWSHNGDTIQCKQHLLIFKVKTTFARRWIQPYLYLLKKINILSTLNAPKCSISENIFFHLNAFSSSEQCTRIAIATAEAENRKCKDKLQSYIIPIQNFQTIKSNWDISCYDFTRIYFLSQSQCKAFPFRRQCFGLKGICLSNALEKNLPYGLYIIPHSPAPVNCVGQKNVQKLIFETNIF